MWKKLEEQLEELPDQVAPGAGKCIAYNIWTKKTKKKKQQKCTPDTA